MSFEAAVKTYAQKTTVVIFTVPEWPDVDPLYNSVHVRLPGGYEFRLSPADAQRLGHALNQAGGGTR